MTRQREAHSSAQPTEAGARHLLPARSHAARARKGRTKCAQNRGPPRAHEDNGCVQKEKTAGRCATREGFAD